MASREMNQQNWRHPANLPDELGRIWLVNLDKTPEGGGSWGIVGMPMPVGWTDPLNMPTSYITQPIGVVGKPDVNRVEVLPGMRRWLVAQKRHEADWKQRAFQVAQRLYGSAAHKMIEQEEEALMIEIGPKPFPTSKVIQAALDGHKGFLGLAPLTKADRGLLGVQNLEDMGFADAPAYAETNPKLPNTSTAPALEGKPMHYMTFVKQMKENGVTDPKEVKEHYKIYRESFAGQE